MIPANKIIQRGKKPEKSAAWLNHLELFRLPLERIREEEAVCEVNFRDSGETDEAAEPQTESRS